MPREARRHIGRALGKARAARDQLSAEVAAYEAAINDVRGTSTPPTALI